MTTNQVWAKNKLRLKIRLENFLWHLFDSLYTVSFDFYSIKSLTMGFQCFVWIPLCAQFVFSTVLTSVNGWLFDGDLYLKRFSNRFNQKRRFFCHYCSQGPLYWRSLLRISGHSSALRCYFSLINLSWSCKMLDSARFSLDTWTMCTFYVVKYEYYQIILRMMGI